LVERVDFDETQTTVSFSPTANGTRPAASFSGESRRFLSPQKSQKVVAFQFKGESTEVTDASVKLP
jgi:hypothetical protein